MNKVIIVGGDHHNGLNLARIFGINNVPVEVVVVTPYTKSWMAKSKFILKSYCVTTEKSAFDYILTKYKEELEKPFIIPCSDGAALELDLRLDEFKDWAYVPSINNTQGEIAKLMDKKAQYDFAKVKDIPMAESSVVELTNFTYPKLSYSEYIVKPVVSAYGNKRDIRICNSKDALLQAAHELKEKGYDSVLIQPYLHIDYEMVIVGCVYNTKAPICVAHKVFRRWPRKTGSNSFSVQCTDENILIQCDKILRIIQASGYCGLIDVEVFVVNEKVYLNEINWRNSGGDFRALHTKFYYALWWYFDILGKVAEIPKQWKSSEDEYSMVEYADFRNVLFREVSLFSWIKDYKKTKNFALKFKGDSLPVFFKFFYRVFRKKQK